MTADMYITSVNGMAETGELINIDGNGNRVASSLYGHKKVWFIVGRNKLAPTYEEALWRARNIAAPKNAQRWAGKRPAPFMEIAAMTARAGADLPGPGGPVGGRSQHGDGSGPHRSGSGLLNDLKKEGRE